MDVSGGEVISRQWDKEKHSAQNAPNKACLLECTVLSWNNVASLPGSSGLISANMNTQNIDSATLPCEGYMHGCMTKMYIKNALRMYA